MDVPGLITLTVGLFGTIYALSSIEHSTASQTVVLVSGAGGIAMLGLFAYSQGSRSNAMLDVELLGNRPFVGAALLPIMMSIGYWSLLAFLPLYFSTVHGLDALRAGAAILPFTIPMLVLPSVGAKLATRVAPCVLFSISFGVIALGDAVMSIGVAGPMWLFQFGMLVAASGAGLGNAQMTNITVSVVPAERSGMASSVNGTMRQAGFVLGIALRSIVLGLYTRGQVQSSAAHEILRGMGALLFVGAAGAAGGVWIALGLLRQGCPARLGTQA
jgi:Na+/melibiose symporter-like transporter